MIQLGSRYFKGGEQKLGCFLINDGSSRFSSQCALSLKWGAIGLPPPPLRIITYNYIDLVKVSVHKLLSNW